MSPDVIDLTETIEPVETTLNFLTYNLWFNEELALNSRMNAIKDYVLGYIVQICCFQEVTNNILRLLKENLPTFKFIPQEQYQILPYFTCICYATHSPKFSIKLSSKQTLPFKNSIMHRALQIAKFDVQDISSKKKMSVLVSTTHLESPLGYKKRLLSQRQKQLDESFKILQSESQNKDQLCLFMG